MESFRSHPLDCGETLMVNIINNKNDGTENMKYYPYASLESKNFRPLLKSAQILGFVSIVGFYITLIIAAISYFTFDPSQLPLTHTAKSQTNAILVGGIGMCFFGFCISAMLAWLVSFTNKASFDVSAKKALKAEKESSSRLNSAAAKLALHSC